MLPMRSDAPMMAMWAGANRGDRVGMGMSLCFGFSGCLLGGGLGLRQPETEFSEAKMDCGGVVQM